ncbi:MAG: AAA family ATPase, partial [Cloacibacillus sp.]
GRAAYGNMNDTMTKIIRSFRDLPNRHVYFSAKMEKAQDETGAMLFSPSMPGKTLTQGLPFFFDEVFALRVGRNDKGEPMRMLMCRPDGLWTAKDRAGALEIWEPADLSAIITKIGGGANG